MGLNGTFINDIRIEGSHVLEEGDKITFGHTNGYKIRPGELAIQPHSEFQFIFERSTLQSEVTSNNALRNVQYSNNQSCCGQGKVPSSPDYDRSECLQQSCDGTDRKCLSVTRKNGCHHSCDIKTCNTGSKIIVQSASINTSSDSVSHDSCSSVSDTPDTFCCSREYDSFAEKNKRNAALKKQDTISFPVERSSVSENTDLKVCVQQQEGLKHSSSKKLDTVCYSEEKYCGSVSIAGSESCDSDCSVKSSVFLDKTASDLSIHIPVIIDSDSENGKSENFWSNELVSEAQKMDSVENENTPPSYELIDSPTRETNSSSGSPIFPPFEQKEETPPGGGSLSLSGRVLFAQVNGNPRDTRPDNSSALQKQTGCEYPNLFSTEESDSKTSLANDTEVLRGTMVGTSVTDTLTSKVHPNGNNKRRKGRRFTRNKRRKRSGDDSDELEEGVEWYDEESCASYDCQKPSERRVAWVQCDDCDKWFHTVCAGCSYETVKDDQMEFHCGCS